MLGACRVTAQCLDGQTRIATIRGTMRKRVWINVGDVLLVSLRDFEAGKCDVLLKYTPEEVKLLQRKGELGVEKDVTNAVEEQEHVEFTVDVDAI